MLLSPSLHHQRDVEAEQERKRHLLTAGVYKMTFWRIINLIKASSKGWLAIAKLKPLVEREFLSTNEKAWFPTVNNKLSLHYPPFFFFFFCDVSETNDECNVSKVQWRKQPAGGGTQGDGLAVIEDISKECFTDNKHYMNNEMLAESYMCSTRCELAVIAGPGENSVEKGEEGGGGKIGRDRWFAAEGSEKQGRVWPWRQMSSRNNTKVLCFNWSGLFRCCHKKSRQESRVGVSSGKSTLEELFTFALISIFSGAACEGGERGKELKRGA